MSLKWANGMEEKSETETDVGGLCGDIFGGSGGEWRTTVSVGGWRQVVDTAVKWEQ